MSDHQDSPMHALYAFSTGDMVALLDLIPCDERESMDIPGQGSITFARCGRVHIMTSTDAGQFSAHAHQDVESAARCYAGAIEHFRTVAASSDPVAEARRIAEGIGASLPPGLREAMARGNVRPGMPQDLPPAIRAALEALREAAGPGVEIISHTVEVSDEDMRGGYL